MKKAICLVVFAIGMSICSVGEAKQSKYLYIYGGIYNADLRSSCSQVLKRCPAGTVFVKDGRTGTTHVSCSRICRVLPKKTAIAKKINSRPKLVRAKEDF
ncbi:hypothetical protein KKH43_05125 [Patescibacteria group bacterium]|nr:hypothetical protein [Patescibacteria group bacterium]